MKEGGFCQIWERTYDGRPVDDGVGDSTGTWKNMTARCSQPNEDFYTARLAIKVPGWEVLDVARRLRNSPGPSAYYPQHVMGSIARNPIDNCKRMADRYVQAKKAVPWEKWRCVARSGAGIRPSAPYWRGDERNQMVRAAWEDRED